jgi:hypothetical protein
MARVMTNVMEHSNTGYGTLMYRCSTCRTFTKPTRFMDGQHLDKRIQGASAQRELDQLLLGCIDGVMTDLLGGNVREAIYDYLAHEFLLAKEEIPSHLDEFSELLANNLGRSAATLERRIARRLNDALGLEFSGLPNHILKEHFEMIRNNMGKEEKKTDSATDEADYSSHVQALGGRLR